MAQQSLDGGFGRAGALHILAHGIDVEHHLAGPLVHAGAHQPGKPVADGRHGGGDLFEGFRQSRRSAGEELDPHPVAAASDPPVGDRSLRP